MQERHYQGLTLEAFLELAARLSLQCVPGSVIYLQGELGAGKTTFARGFLRGLGFQESVKSPTYTLVESYSLKDFSVYHFDLYRIRHPSELEWFGVQDYFTAEAVCLIEWPDLGKGRLPPPDVSCYIEVVENARHVKLIAHSEKGKRIVR